MSEMFLGFADEVRAYAISAGCNPDDLKGPLRCLGGCGEEVPRLGGSCERCVKKRISDEHAKASKSAWETVPLSLRWAALGSDVLPFWVRDNEAVDHAKKIATDITNNTFVTLVGPAGSGKTTLACALLRSWAKLYKRMASSIRFAAAHDLVYDQACSRLGEHVVSIDMARHASVLVLDEVGRGKDTHGVIFGILHERHRSLRPTIITTPHETPEAFAAATGDGGLTRRVFGDASLIRVRGVQ